MKYRIVNKYFTTSIWIAGKPLKSAKVSYYCNASRHPTPKNYSNLFWQRLSDLYLFTYPNTLQPLENKSFIYFE